MAGSTKMEPLRDLVEDGTDLPASSPASSAELFKAITAALSLCTTVAFRINKRGKKLHVEHEYGAEVAKEFDAVDPLGEKGSADNKELKKAIEKVKGKKPSSSSSRAKPASSSRNPESSRRGSDNRREGGRPKRTLGLAVKNAKEPFACDLRVLRWEDVSFFPTYLEFRFVKRKNDQHRLFGKVRVAKMPGAVVCVYGLLRRYHAVMIRWATPTLPVFPGSSGTVLRHKGELGIVPSSSAIEYPTFRRYLARWLSPLLTPALTEAAFLTRFGTQSGRSGARRFRRRLRGHPVCNMGPAWWLEVNLGSAPLHGAG
eukprot:jgi/Tetstr1/459584/TSEL_004948.t1